MALTEAHCYRLLGLSNASTLEEIRSAYRSIARRMHPDRAGGDAERFKEITAAYNLLVGRATGRIPAEKKARKRPARGRRPRQSEAGARRSRPRAESQRARYEESTRREEAPRREARREEASARAEQSTERRQTSREARRKARARSARRHAWDQARAQSDDRWDEEFAEAWSAWCRTAERFHAEDARRRAERTAETTSESRDEADPNDSVESRRWAPPRAGAEADAGAEQGGESASFFNRMRNGWKKVRRKVALDRVGHDVSLRLAIDPATQLFGGTRRVAITRAAACPSCGGHGDSSCICGGKGRIKVRETVSVVVPPGARAGARLRVEGKGTAGLDGAVDGDLYLLLEPAAIPGFDRDGLNLRGTVTLSDRLAGQGGTVTVDLPRGKVKLTVPPKTRAGDTFRLRGQGLTAWGEDARGDLFLAVAVR